MPDLPISSALAEAQSNSLQEIFARAPSALSDSDYEFLVSELRKMRLRLEEADAAGKKPRQSRAGGTAEDFGL